MDSCEVRRRSDKTMEREVLVGTADGLHQLGDQTQVSLASRVVNSLAMGESGWWAVVDRTDVWQSSSGADWEQVASVEGLHANCVLPTPEALYVGTSEARLLVLQGEQFAPVELFDRVEGRDEWSTPWGGLPDIRSMAADPSGTVYANVRVGGVVRSANAGRSWQPTIDIRSDVHQVIFDPGSGQVLAASARGLASSADGGETWSFDSDGLHGGYLRAVAVANGTVLVTASTGPFTQRAAVYRRAVDSGEPFVRCQEGLPEWFPENVDTFCLAAKGASVVFGTSDGSVFVSSDEGLSWSTLAEGLPSVRCVAFA